MNTDRYAEAEQLYLSSDWRGAAAILEDVVAGNPNHLEAWVMLAAALRQLRKYDRCAETYAKVVELDPANDIWRQHLTHVLEQAGRHDQAADAEAALGTGGPTPATT